MDIIFISTSLIGTEKFEDIVKRMIFIFDVLNVLNPLSSELFF